MGRKATITVKVDADLKAQAKEVLKSWGLTMTDAVDIFLRKIIEYRSISFEITQKDIDEVKARRNKK